VPSTPRAALPSPLFPQFARTFKQLAYHPHKGVGMSAYRTSLNGGLALRSCTLGRAPWCPLNNSLLGLVHSYDILGAGMLWKPKETRILTNAECFDKVFYHVNSRILKCKMTNVITLVLSVLLIIGSSISYLCGFCLFGSMIMWHHLADTLDKHYMHRKG